MAVRMLVSMVVCLVWCLAGGCSSREASSADGAGAPVAASASSVTSAPVAVPMATPSDELGWDVARHLQARYDDSVQDCGGKTAPPNLCSGILLRSTTYGDDYHSWMPNPGTSKGGVVFSWLRQDANFDDTGLTANGFFVYPSNFVSSRGLTPLTVRCVFPLEARSPGTTDDRCRFQSPLCHERTSPVLTALEWKDVPFTKGADQCAFGTAAAIEGGPANAWMQMIGVRKLFQANTRNEVIVASWEGIDEKTMPVEAFFYRVTGNADPGVARDSARKDQEKFLAVTGRLVPVIRWESSSKSEKGDATFSYVEADQAVLPGESGGASVARYLQSRYDSSLELCPGTPARPSFACSGLLIRSTWYSDLYYSWRPNPATADWGVSFSWLRKNSNFADSYPTGNGFVVYPQDDASRHGLTVFNIRCAFPRDSWSASPDRCTWHQNGSAPRVQTPLCHLHEPAILTAEEWRAAGYKDDEKQCAFSTDAAYSGRAEAWHQMLRVRSLDQARWRNELIVDAWLGLDDSRMPIEAFFYRPESRSDKPDPLDGARQDQRDFFKLTGIWKPVIRWDPTDKFQGGATFSYRDADQLIPPQPSPSMATTSGLYPQESGKDVERHLLARMTDTSNPCGSAETPAFICSGVLVRSTKYDRNSHSWLAGPGAASRGVSFSWMRNDSDMAVLKGNNGFIAYPKKYSDARGLYALNVLCGYPFDGSSRGADHGCKPACQDMTPSVTSPKQWTDRFADGKNPCAFGLEAWRGDGATAFMQLVDVRRAEPLDRFNDIVVEAWPDGIRGSMPVEAFWYAEGNAAGLAEARLDQQDFKSAVGRWVPIVKWTPAAQGRSSTFTFSEADQAVKP